MLRFLLAALIALFPTPAVPRAGPGIELEAVRVIVCAEGFGTAFVIADRTLVTADHIAYMHNCREGMTGRPVVPYHRDETHDFALLTGDTTGMPKLRYSCERYVTGRVYANYGYGERGFTSHDVTARSGYTDNTFVSNGLHGNHIQSGMRAFTGEITSGQSGGPVVDDEGVVHGINNVSDDATHESWSYELADTILCRRP